MKKPTTKSCTCKKCQQGCLDNPGWFTPDEAIKAIEAGHAKRMMRDWLEPCNKVGNKSRTYVLAPAAKGYEGKNAPAFDDIVAILFALAGGHLKKGRCTFFKRGRCEIHSSGFKPLQCRTALMCTDEQDDFKDDFEMARMWKTKRGREALAMWKRALAT